MVFDALLDLMELQKGTEVNNDPERGMLSFISSLYGVEWKIEFTIIEIDRTRCAVAVVVAPVIEDGETVGYAEIMARRECALLDSLLLIGTPHEISCYEEGYQQ